MSKRQEKIERAREAQQMYLDGQAAYQGIRILIQLQRAYETGLHLYEENKDKLSEEERAEIERMKEEQLKSLNELKSNLGLPQDWTYHWLEEAANEPADTPAEA